jgi:hypothetical protein
MTQRRLTLRRLTLLVPVVLAAAGTWLALPPRAVRLTVDPATAAVRGAYHVHSNRSDGTGTMAEIAAAAARAGLQFVIVTDHSDGTRLPDAPAYINGVLMIDAVEISTFDGHVTALGMPASRYPLGGAARDVVADIIRLNGVAVAAHPGSVKPELQWTDWDVPVHGLEWINGDSEWREEGMAALGRALLTYPFRPGESLASLVDRPEAVIRRWDALLATRPVVALAGSDAHARLGLRDTEPFDGRAALRTPGYQQMFRVMSLGIPRLALALDADADAASIVTAIAEGNVFSTIDALAGPAAFGFIGTSSGIRVGVGGRLPVGQPVDFAVTTNAPPGARVALLKDGQTIAEADAAMRLQYTAPAGPGVYRVEVSLPGAPGTPPVPWILSNPIYVRPDAAAGVAAPVTASSSKSDIVRSVRYADGPATGWRVEQSPLAKGALDVTAAPQGTEILLRYGLGGTRSEGSFVAAAMPANGIAGYDRLLLTVRATKPMRFSVELRVPGGLEGERWSRSVYADETVRQVTVPFSDMRSRGETSTPRPALDRVDTVLFVVDTLNTAIGSNGQLWLDDVAFGRPSPEGGRRTTEAQRTQSR